MHSRLVQRRAITIPPDEARRIPMSRPSLIVPGFLLAVLLMATPASAHEGGVDVRGEVLSADTQRVTVRGGDGHERRYVLTPKTRITLGGIAAKPADVTPGLRAVVHGRKVDGVITATSVQLARPAEPGTPKRPQAP